VTISQMRGEAVDYLVITPGDGTPLDGETLIVDDMYNGIHYSGSGWISVASDFSFLEYTIPVYAQAFQNGTHQTSSIGDSFTFSYTGKLLFMHSPTYMPHLNIYRKEHDNLWHCP
jgi:hypothetical protein